MKLKAIIKIIFISFSITASAQKEYFLDYKLTLEQTFYKTNNTRTTEFYINTLDNGYILKVDKKSNDYLLLFLEVKEKLAAIARVKEDVFNNNTKFSAKKGIKSNLKDDYSKHIKNYNFQILNDTVINKVSYYHYVLKWNKKKTFLNRKKTMEEHFIVYKNYEKILPVFPEHLAYVIWKKSNKQIPNGMPYMIYKLNRNKEFIDKIVVKEIAPTNKVIIVPKVNLPKTNCSSGICIQ